MFGQNTYRVEERQQELLAAQSAVRLIGPIAYK